jgi:hypothetical protein
MAAFMTRVELHKALEPDYEVLHSAMETEGFKRTITSNDSVSYNLPTAEYYRNANLTKGQILESAKRAATTTRKAFAVVVTESNGVTWEGLSQG